jgi:FixJ family two-component response regulator
MTSGDRHRIAVIDDDQSMRRAIERLLSAAGWRPDTFGRAEEFLQYDAADFECLIVDVRLPGLSGRDMIDVIERHGPLPPVVFITAHKDSAEDATRTATATQAVLLKPFPGSELLAAVDRVTKRTAPPQP